MSTHRNSARKEINSIFKGLRQFQAEVGTTILWYEFDRANSTSSDTYGEGAIPDPFDPSLYTPSPGLTFKPPKYIPVIWLRFIPPESVQSETGEYTVYTATIRISAKTMRESGLMSPLDPAAHYNDRFFYNGTLYRVENYAPKGWVHDTWINVDVAGRQIKQEELESDNFEFWEDPSTATAWTPGEQLTWPATQPGDLES